MPPHFSLPNIIPNTPPESPRIPAPQTPRSTVSSASSTRTRFVPVKVNNRIIYVDERLKKCVCNAADSIRSNWGNALRFEKELILNPNILIELLNHAKLYWHDWLDMMPYETSASERIENAFINNKNLSKEESDWVRQIISDYKNIVEMTVSQSNSNPIPPIRMVHKEPVSKKCSCNIL